MERDGDGEGARRGFLDRPEDFLGRLGGGRRELELEELGGRCGGGGGGSDDFVSRPRWLRCRCVPICICLCLWLVGRSGVRGVHG